MAELINMLPFLSTHNIANSAWIDIEYFGQLALIIFSLSMPITYLSYLLLRQFSRAAAFSDRGITAALLDHIIYVVLLRSQKQMGRIYTARIIAMVQDKQTIWNRPIMQFPRKTMGRNRTTSNRKAPIASRICSCCPIPASQTLLDMRPKSYFIGRFLLFCRWLFRGSFLASTLIDFIPVFCVISRIVYPYSFTALNITDMATRFAFGAQTVFASLLTMKMLSCSRKFIAANSTRLSWGIHDAFLSSYSKMLSEGAGIWRFVGLQSLSDIFIIPQMRFA